MTTETRDCVRRYVIVHVESNRIVARFAGTHATLERICHRLDREHHGTYVYDDDCRDARALYLPQLGPNISLTRR